jgi:hypothetical protein
LKNLTDWTAPEIYYVGMLTAKIIHAYRSENIVLRSATKISVGGISIIFIGNG